MSAVLVLTGGPDHAHDFERSGAALAAVVSAVADSVEVVRDPDEAAAALGTGRFDGFVVNALRWRMLADRYAPWRAEWGYATPAATRSTIAGFVAAGGGLVGNHTASICFDDWPEWGRMLGGAWSWDRSSHPPVGPVRAMVTTPHHPVAAGLPAELHLVDEVYGDLDLDDGIEVIATARRHDADEDQPVVWAHRYGDGRVVYDGFGHDDASLHHPDHALLLRNAVTWILGADT